MVVWSDVFLYSSTYTLKMATWVDETCWWSMCNERNS